MKGWAPEETAYWVAHEKKTAYMVSGKESSVFVTLDDDGDVDMHTLMRGTSP